MKVFELPEILAALDSGAVMTAVADAFVRPHRGGAQITPPGHLTFPGAHGDGHLKGGFLTGDDVFTVKLATSFYRNPGRGLPVSNGFIAVISAHAGQVRPGQLTELGALLARPRAFPAEAVVVADLTGVAVQDVAIARSVWTRLAG